MGSSIFQPGPEVIVTGGTPSVTALRRQTERAGNLGSTYLSRTRRDLIAVIGGGATDWPLAARAQKPGRTVPRSLLARADDVIE
jgi:hypothetical protein